MTPSRRVVGPAVAALVVVLLTGCAPGPDGPASAGSASSDGSEHGVSHRGPEPTARSSENGIETWDLTVPPSVEAFGIDTDVPDGARTRVGAYGSEAGGWDPVRIP